MGCGQTSTADAVDFKFFDINGDRSVTASEIAQILRENNREIPLKVIETAILLSDANKNGTI